MRDYCGGGGCYGWRTSDWVHIQANSGEELMQLHHFSMVKQQTDGNVTFAIMVKEPEIDEGR